MFCEKLESKSHIEAEKPIRPKLLFGQSKHELNKLETTIEQ